MLSLNLSYSWFDLVNPRIILLRSPTLGSEQALLQLLIQVKKHGLRTLLFLKEPGASQEVPSDKAAVVPEVGAASQGFQKELALIVLFIKGASKDEEGTTTSEADNPTNKTSKLQIKLKK